MQVLLHVFKLQCNDPFGCFSLCYLQDFFISFLSLSALIYIDNQQMCQCIR